MSLANTWIFLILNILGDVKPSKIEIKYEGKMSGCHYGQYNKKDDNQ